MSNISKGILRVGTSGIVVPGSKENYPEEFKDKSRLYYYSSLFNTLEVNSTFKKLPMNSTFEKWASDVVEEFQFTIKASREITHAKKLETDLSDIEKFYKAADHIGIKKGCLLIQFPGSITVDYYGKVEQILNIFSELNEAGQWRVAVELRNNSWYIAETFELLDELGFTLVLQDMPKSKTFIPNPNATFIYIRYHGPTGTYRGSYCETFLQEQATMIRGWLNEGKDVYAYFNNTMGDAYKNAMDLKAMVNQSSVNTY